MSTPDFPEELATQLVDAADAIDQGDSTVVLAQVRGAAGRRRRRRQAAMGVAAVGALAASGLVIANVAGDNGDDLLVTATAPETEAEATDEVTDEEQTVADPAIDPTPPASTPPPVERPLEVSPASVESVADTGLVIDQEYAGDTQLYPWNGGFLAVQNRFLPQQLPAELPPEIAERFPQEVLDLFPDGLPSTLDEATVILQDAGLFDVVSEIVLSDPEVSEAIYGVPSQRETSFRFSEDGVEWDDIDVDLPVDAESYPVLASAGDRFVAVVPVAEGAAQAQESPTGFEVWSTVDLVSWERQDVALPSQPNDLPDFVRTNTFVSSVAVNEDAWVVSLARYTQFDPYLLLDDELEAALDTPGGYGTSMNETGLTVEVYSGEPEPGPPELVEFTWEELGIDEPPQDEQETLTYTAAWGGVPQKTEIGGNGDYGFGQTVALDSGFVAVGSDLRLSDDGVRWSPVQLPNGGNVDWLIETDAGLVVSGNSETGEPFRLLFDPASSEFSPIDLGDAPASGWGQVRGRHAVVVEDYGEEQGDPFGSFGSSASVERDGYLLEVATRFSGEVNSVSYVLTDVATGEVVSTEAFDPTEDGQMEFEYVKEVYDVPGELEGFRVFDPESGDVLLEVPFSSFDWVQLDADGEPIPESEYRIPSEESYVEPTQWLIASVGESLVSQFIDGANEETYLSSVAVQGNVVLIARSNGEMTRIVAEG